MKLASYRDGSRDGQLVVVSRDLQTAHYASGIAGRLQQVLDDWNFLSPQLEALSQTLNHGKARHAFAFEPARCLAPLPRAFHRASGAPQPVQRAGDALLGAHDEIAFPADAQPGLVFGAGFAAITGDVPAGSTPEAALESIRLLVLVADLHLSADDVIGSFGPVAATPDELGAAWHGGRLQLTLETHLGTQRNGRRLDTPGAADESPAHLGSLIATLCRRRAVRAGSIVGHAPQLGLLAAADTLHIEVKGNDGASVFGAVRNRIGAVTAVEANDESADENTSESAVA